MVLLCQKTEEKYLMKKLIPLVALMALLTTAACQQKTETVVDETGTMETSTVTTTYPAVDTAATAAATDAAADTWNTTTAATATAANEAARQTGTALEQAGQEIQEETTTTTNPQ